MSQLSVSRDEHGVATVAVDRPPANAMDVALLGELVAALDALPPTRPPRWCSRGARASSPPARTSRRCPSYGPDEQRAMVDGINAMALGVYALPCPVVGAITGHAIAGGMVLAICTDLRVASSEGKYGLTEVRVGVPYPQAAIGVVEAELPVAARRLFAFGNALHDAQTCLRLGVFDEVVEPAAVVPRAQTLARDLATMPGDVYARTKRDLRGATIERLRAAAADDPLLARWV